MLADEILVNETNGLNNSELVPFYIPCIWPAYVYFLLGPLLQFAKFNKQRFKRESLYRSKIFKEYLLRPIAQACQQNNFISTFRISMLSLENALYCLKWYCLSIFCGSLIPITTTKSDKQDKNATIQY